MIVIIPILWVINSDVDGESDIMEGENGEEDDPNYPGDRLVDNLDTFDTIEC